MSAPSKVKIAPTSFRVENIEILDLLTVLPSIVQDKELEDVRPTVLTLYSPKRARSIQIQTMLAAPGTSALTVICDDSQLLDRFIQSLNKAFEKAGTP